MFKLLRPMALRGDFQTVIQKLEEMTDDARAKGSGAPELADVLADAAGVRLALGDLSTASLHIAEILTGHHDEATCRAHALLSTLKTYRGETAEAEDHLETALDLSRSSSNVDLRMQVALAGVEWCLATDRISEAHEFLAEMRPTEKHDRTTVLLRTAQCQLREDKIEDAMTNVREAIKLGQWDGFQEQEWEGFWVLAQIYRKLGNRQDYHSSIDRASGLIFQISDRLSPELQAPFLAFPRRATVLRLGQELMFPNEKKTPERLYKQMLEATETLNRQHDVRKLLDASVDAAVEFCDALRGYMLVSDAAGTKLQAGRHMSRRPLTESELKFAHDVVDIVSRSGQAMLSSNVLKDGRLESLEQTTTIGMCSVLCVPLRTRQRKVGVLYVDSSSTSRTYTEDDLLMMQTFADHAAQAIDNALELAVSVRDLLTGLYSGAHFWRALDRELRRARRHQKDLAVAMVNVDSLKRINQQFDASAGDRVLRHAAQLLKDRLPEATLARHHDDEFLVLWPGSSEHAWRAALEKVLREFHDRPVELDGASVTVTVSIGAVTAPRNGNQPRDLLLAAEKALHRAKEAGKNRVELA